ncbi:MAG TPA: inositol monophosphatase [Dehalococcoidia bacterium]|nr:inositol monophosphatase [Dehalococcoidia bacterium]
MTGIEELQLRREVAIEAARAAAEVHLRYRGQQLERDVHAGERTDYATRVDLEAQDAVKAAVARHFPDEPVIGEEDHERYGEVEALLQTGCWFTDPLDGTADYVHGSPHFSAIVSYVAGGEALACAIYFPVLDELFSAAKGQGATLNAGRCRVSRVDKLSGAILATAFRGSDPVRVTNLATRVQTVLPHIEAIRLPGAPSVMACAVACGRYDVFTMMGQALEAPPAGRPFLGQPWETAAFVVLVQEAGGAVRGLSGGAPDLLGYNVFAPTQGIIDELDAVMQDVLRPPRA